MKNSKFLKLFNKVMESCNIDIMKENSLNRIYQKMNLYDCAILSAYRNKITNITDKTDLTYPDGTTLSLKDNKERTNILFNDLIDCGFKPQKIYGTFQEDGQFKSSNEESFIIFNLNKIPLNDFYKQIKNLSEKFNQDSFLFKPVGKQAVFIGTNNAERNLDEFQPGYGKSKHIGDFHSNLISPFGSNINNPENINNSDIHSKVNKGFQFR